VFVILEGVGGAAAYHRVYRDDIISIRAPLTSTELLVEEL